MEYPQPPPMPKAQFLPNEQPQQPTRAELRRSLFVELSTEMEILEREALLNKDFMSKEFNNLWEEFFGPNVFLKTRDIFKQRLGL
jgi:hypothetical protein